MTRTNAAEKRAAQEAGRLAHAEGKPVYHQHGYAQAADWRRGWQAAADEKLADARRIVLCDYRRRLAEGGLEAVIEELVKMKERTL